MADEAIFTLALDPALHSGFLAEAEAANRLPQDLLRDLMRDFVKWRRHDRDAVVRTEIEQALREADDLAVGLGLPSRTIVIHCMVL